MTAKLSIIFKEDINYTHIPIVALYRFFRETIDEKGCLYPDDLSGDNSSFWKAALDRYPNVYVSKENGSVRHIQLASLPIWSAAFDFFVTRGWLTLNEGLFGYDRDFSFGKRADLEELVNEFLFSYWDLWVWNAVFSELLDNDYNRYGTVHSFCSTWFDKSGNHYDDDRNIMFFAMKYLEPLRYCGLINVNKRDVSRICDIWTNRHIFDVVGLTDRSTLIRQSHDELIGALRRASLV